MFWSMCKKSLIRWGLVLLLWKIKDTKIPTTSAFHELQWPSLYSGTSGWLISRRKRYVRLNPKPSYTKTIGKSLKNVIKLQLGQKSISWELNAKSNKSNQTWQAYHYNSKSSNWYFLHLVVLVCILSIWSISSFAVIRMAISKGGPAKLLLEHLTF